MSPPERRNGNRTRVAITATVTGHAGYPRLKCAIRDASSDGCKLVSACLEALPDMIEIAVEGVTQPVQGQIVWRGDKQAGVRFTWPQEVSELPEEDDFLDLGEDHAID